MTQEFGHANVVGGCLNAESCCFACVQSVRLEVLWNAGPDLPLAFLIAKYMQ